jgi:hypothetical protein
VVAAGENTHVHGNSVKRASIARENPSPKEDDWWQIAVGGN